MARQCPRRGGSSGAIVLDSEIVAMCLLQPYPGIYDRIRYIDHEIGEHEHRCP
jgi:hypothetical protein